MSRIGNKPIALEGATFERENNLVTVKGPKGTLTQEIDRNIATEVVDGAVHVKYEGAEYNAKQGLYRALIHNMIVGVTKGWSKKLIISGVGYKASVSGKKLQLGLGLSHQVNLDIPEGLTVTCPAALEVVVSGADRQQVGQFCAVIMRQRPYEPYHGYGIHAEGDRLVRKVGKAAGKGKK